MLEQRRIIASLAPQLGGGMAYSELPDGYNGITKMIYESRVAIFPTHSVAVCAAKIALSPDLGGYTEVSLVTPVGHERITHNTAVDWLLSE